MQRFLLILIVLCAACGAVSSPTATPSSTPQPTATLTATSPPTMTPTNSPTPSETPSPTATVIPTDTPIPTETPIPVDTPLPTPGMIFDHWELAELPESITTGLSGPLVAFVNQNNSETIRNLSTPQPPTNSEVLYFASPSNPTNRVAILELEAATNDQIYVAPRGNAVAYMVDAPGRSGLYVLNVTSGLTGRILHVSSLAQRGIFSAPAWNPDGLLLAVTVETGYDLDIRAFDVRTSSWSNLIEHGSFDFWPAWSPDGRYLAFVSDRARCPTWNPAGPNACDPDADPLPMGGHVYIMEVATGEVTQLSEIWTTEPPYWVNNRQIVFTGGDRFDLSNPSRTLWVGTVPDMTARQIILAASSGSALYLSESWSDSGGRVIFQHVDGETTEIVAMRSDGTRLATIEGLSFARFGMSADWSPDSTRIAIGGSGGQCPYGIRVIGADFSRVATGNPPPTMCDPVFSPDGEFIAFSGVNPGTADGRVDIYTTSANGFNAINLTADLRGQMKLLGWVGPR